MSNSKSIKSLLVVVAFLLIANLIRPLWTPGTAHAQDEGEAPGVAITGAGTTAWIIKDSNLYYAVYEKQYESIRIYGPEELPEE
jgi:hypothetical protein